jgi:hypothetical protein
MPPMISILSGLACLIGLVTSNWVVLTRVPYFSGEFCEKESGKTGTSNSMLLSADFCSGSLGCGRLMIVLGIIGCVGTFFYLMSGVYGLYKFFGGGQSYARFFYHGVMVGFLLTATTASVYFIYMAVFKGIRAVDHTCSGWSAYVFACGSGGGLLCWMFVCLPVLENMSQSADTPILPVRGGVPGTKGSVVKPPVVVVPVVGSSNTGGRFNIVNPQRHSVVLQATGGVRISNVRGGMTSRTVNIVS